MSPSSSPAPQPEPHPPVDLPDPVRVVGRSGELARIEKFLERVERGAGRGLVLSAGPGVGKTRLLRETQVRANARGFTVLSTKCSARSQGVPLAPWVDMARRFVDSAPREEVYRTLGPHLSELMTLVPELMDRVWLYDPATEPRERDPARLVEAIPRVFAEIAQVHPLLLSLDDLHHADAASLELLAEIAQVSRGIPLGVVVAFRDPLTAENNALRLLLRSAEREKAWEIMALSPLGPDGLGELAGALLDRADLPAQLTHRLYAVSGGNPSYAREVLQWLVDRGTIRRTPEGWSWDTVPEVELPPAVQRTIELRLGRPDEESARSRPRAIRLAVLPFTNISADPKDRYLADGLTEELISALSRSSGLQVIARSSVMPYASTSKGVPEIAAELQVSSVLEGSVRKSGDRLRVSVRLVDARSLRPIWSETFERELRDLFQVQSQIAEQVTAALTVELRADVRARRVAISPVGPDSYLAYLKGRTLSIGVDEKSRLAAKEQFELAISLDPSNAAAYTGLADILRQIRWTAKAVGGDWDQRSRELVARAREIDPELPEAHVSSGMIACDDHEWAAADREFQRAISLNPSLPSARFCYGMLLEMQGRPKEALPQLVLAEAGDPLNPWIVFTLGELLLWSGDVDEALGQFKKLRRRMSHSDSPGVTFAIRHTYHHGLARVCRARGDRDGYLREIDRVVRVDREPIRRRVYRAWYEAVAGRSRQATDLLRKAERMPNFPTYFEHAAYVTAEMRDLDSTFRFLELARQTGNHGPPDYWRLDPLMAHVRADPRFDAWLRALRLA